MKYILSIIVLYIVGFTLAFGQATFGGKSLIGGKAVAGAGGAAVVAATIAFDNSLSQHDAQCEITVCQTSLSFSYTVNSNSNGILCIAVGFVDTNLAATVSSATYNGASLTKVITQPTGTGYSANSNRIEQWCKLTPATGSNTLVVNISAAPANDWDVGVISLTGVHQSLTPDASSGNSAASGQPGGSVTTIANNAWIVDGIVDNGLDTPLATSPSNRRYLENSSRSYGGSTKGPVTPAGSTTMAWTGLTSAFSQVITSWAPGP